MPRRVRDERCRLAKYDVKTEATVYEMRTTAHNYAAELYSLHKRFKDLTLVRETALTTDKWAKRGLDRTIMERSPTE